MSFTRRIVLLCRLHVFKHAASKITNVIALCKQENSTCLNVLRVKTIARPVSLISLLHISYETSGIVIFKQAICDDDNRDTLLIIMVYLSLMNMSHPDVLQSNNDCNCLWTCSIDMFLFKIAILICHVNYSHCCAFFLHAFFVTHFFAAEF